jgi:putative ABC transport system ATP-binding protein
MSTSQGSPLAGPALEFVDVVKGYGAGATEVRALTDVTLSFPAGQFCAVMGPSGCGKSTLLHLAGALEPPSAGRVLVDGADVSTMSAVEQANLRRRHVGYVFQQLNLIPALTAVENVMLPLELDGVPTREARARATEMLRRVDLTHQIDRYPDDFSGGQRQRIAIARAVIGDRRLLLADEPTGALDTVSSDEIVSLLASVSQQNGATVVMVTHEPRLASWADRTVFLRDGRLVDDSGVSTGPTSVEPAQMDHPGTDRGQTLGVWETAP